MTKRTKPSIGEQLSAAKRLHPDLLCLFVCGDFLESFGADARVVGKTLGLTITERDGLPMCGFPRRNSCNYIGKLKAAGCRCAIIERAE